MEPTRVVPGLLIMPSSPKSYYCPIIMNTLLVVAVHKERSINTPSVEEIKNASKTLSS